MHPYLEFALCVLAFLMCWYFAHMSNDGSLFFIACFAASMALWTIGVTTFAPVTNTIAWIITIIIIAYFSKFYINGCIQLIFAGYTEEPSPRQRNIALIAHCWLLIPLAIMSTGAIIALRRAIYITIIGAMRAFSILLAESRAQK